MGKVRICPDGLDCMADHEAAEEEKVANGRHFLAFSKNNTFYDGHENRGIRQNWKKTCFFLRFLDVVHIHQKPIQTQDFRLETENEHIG